ncbi:hypothetical protein ACBJ59_10960 [Nonomuraea sp. MTCD27]|uniref:hypothetical protein n=1 Tax=Nonomuraea sp. MTCD27 TaxID=1676747 RepID=UPI0035BF8C1C
MPDLTALITPGLILAAALIGAAITHHLHQTSRNTRTAQLEHRATALANDRDTLLKVVGEFVDAIEHRPDRLDTVAAQARHAIDGRSSWAPTS